jgi:hypothetical protein
VSADLFVRELAKRGIEVQVREGEE